jgi:hypothetical protein
MRGKLLTNQEIINDFNKVHNNKFNYSLVDYKNTYTKIKIICPIHGIFEQLPSHHKRGIGCKGCFKDKITSSIDKFIIKSNLIHNNKFNYSLVNYINAHTKVKIICKKHGIFEQTPNKHLCGRGCPICNESKGEKEIKTFLINNNINYKTQKTFEKCFYKQKLKFDFYLPKYNICIEYDGDQHYTMYRFEKDDSKLKIRKIRDKIKNKYCKENNIKLIRLNPTNIKKINNYLYNLID